MSDDTNGSIDHESSRERERKWRRNRQPLDFSPSSTATSPSHAAQDTSERTKTGRHAYTENATFTMEQMSAPSRQKDEAADAVEELTSSDEQNHSEWTSLNQANRNYFADGEKNNRSEQRRQDFINDTSTWGKQIGLTDYEIERAISLVECSEEGWRNNHGTEAIILSALVLSANEQGKAIRPSNPISDNFIDMKNTYTEIRDNLNVDKQNVKSCRNYLQQFL